jgi:hypothetical protein
MTKSYRFAIPGMVLLSGLFLLPQKSPANADYTKMTGKKCVYCHIGDWSSGKFTDAGHYYGEHKTFRGYVAKDPNSAQPPNQQKEKPAKT